MTIERGQPAESESPQAIVARLDRANDLEGLRRYGAESSDDHQQIVFALFKLLAAGRFESAWALAGALNAQRVFSPIIDLGLAVGGAIHGTELDAALAVERLIRSMRTLFSDINKQTFQAAAAPVLERALADQRVRSSAALAEKIALVRRIVAAPDGKPGDDIPPGELRGQDFPAIWAPLIEELDRWAEAGRVSTFWWRDDDVYDAEPSLDRLLALAGARPVTFAVIPGVMREALAARLANETRATMIQHGWTHLPHGEMGTEYPEDRSPDEVRQEIAAGRSVLVEQFAGRALPVFAPPWCRFPRRFLPLLAECGIGWIANAGGRQLPEPEHGIRELNTQIDMLDWFAPLDAVGAICAHLRARRTGSVAPGEPTGLLTHHKIQDEQSWRYLARLLPIIDAHPGARWLHGGEVFAAA